MNFFKAILLSKLAEIMDVPVSEEITQHFPLLNQQQNWKYKHAGGRLFLNDKGNTYAFSWPDELYPKDEEAHSFPIARLPHDNYDQIEGTERVAQVHRAHPGEIYVTLHEGTRNPTYTLKHQKDNDWKAILKKKVSKHVKELEVEKTASSWIEDRIKFNAKYAHSMNDLVGGMNKDFNGVNNDFGAVNNTPIGAGSASLNNFVPGMSNSDTPTIQAGLTSPPSLPQAEGMAPVSANFGKTPMGDPNDTAKYGPKMNDSNYASIMNPPDTVIPKPMGKDEGAITSNNIKYDQGAGTFPTSAPPQVTSQNAIHPGYHYNTDGSITPFDSNGPTSATTAIPSLGNRPDGTPLFGEAGALHSPTVNSGNLTDPTFSGPISPQEKHDQYQYGADRAGQEEANATDSRFSSTPIGPEPSSPTFSSAPAMISNNAAGRHSMIPNPKYDSQLDPSVINAPITHPEMVKNRMGREVPDGTNLAGPDPNYGINRATTTPLTPPSTKFEIGNQSGNNTSTTGQSTIGPSSSNLQPGAIPQALPTKKIAEFDAEVKRNLKIAGIEQPIAGVLQSFSNLPAPLVAGGALGASYLLNRHKPQNDPMDQQHPIISKLIEYGIPAATAMAIYYGGKGLFNPTATAAFNPVS
jgi:hypothetical protein